VSIKNWVALKWEPDFEVLDQIDIFNLKRWKNVIIPWVFNDDWSPKTEIITKLDLLNFRWLDENWVEKLIYDTFSIDIWTKEWIQKLNNLFFEWLSFLKLVGRKVPKKYKHNTIPLKSKKEIIDFCLLTTKERTKTAYENCLISKSVFIVNEILSNTVLEKLETKKQFLLNKLKQNWAFIFQTDTNWYLKIKNEDWTERKSFFTLIPREKSVESAQLKVWKDPKSSVKMLDELWFSFYLENKKDSLFFMQYLSDILYCWNFQVSNKNAIDKNDPDTFYWLNSTFLKKLDIVDEEIASLSNEKYSEVKLKWIINIPDEDEMHVEWAFWDDVWVEIKFMGYDSKNDDWLSFQPVYWYLKYIDVLCRILQGYVSENAIDYIVNLFFINLDENINKKNKLLPTKMFKSKEEYLEELEEEMLNKWILRRIKRNWNTTQDELKNWLKKYYLSKLIKVKVDWKQGFYYATKREYNLSLAWYKPKMIKK